MKKYIIISLAALFAMCACTKVEPNQPADQAISFSVVNYASATKATTTAESEFTKYNSSFGVYAYYNTVDWDNGGVTTNVYINGDEVKHAAPEYITNPTAKQDWATEDAYYWPKTGKLTFVGWAPYAKTPTSFDKTAGFTWKDYLQVVAPGETNKVDLMYSDIAKDQTGNSENYQHEGVPMLFHHALAKLNFTLEYNTDNLTDDQIGMFEIVVTDITLKSLGNTATYTSGAWTLSTAATAKADQALAGTSDTLNEDNLTQDNYVLDYFIIPQAAAELWVNYTINGIECETAKLTLSEAPWAKNTVYTYNLLISPIGDEPITFDPSVASWTVLDAVDIDVENVTPSTK